LGSLAVLGILKIQGLGDSHGELTTIVVSGLLGTTCGTIALPIVVWMVMREPRK
jgi:hypothetical protein